MVVYILISMFAYCLGGCKQDTCFEMDATPSPILWDSKQLEFLYYISGGRENYKLKHSTCWLITKVYKLNRKYV